MGGGGGELGQHQVAVRQILRFVRGKHQASLGAPVHGLDARLTPALAHHAQQPVGALAQTLDHPRLELARLELFEADQKPVAETGCAGLVFMPRRRQAHDRSVVSRQLQLHEQIAVGAALDHVGHPHGRQGPSLREPLAASPAQHAFALQLLQQQPHRAPVFALQAEVPGDRPNVGLAGFANIAGERLAVGDAGGFAGRPGSGQWLQ